LPNYDKTPNLVTLSILVPCPHERIFSGITFHKSQDLRLFPHFFGGKQGDKIEQFGLIF